jgi:hypothetical protein
MPRLPEPDPFVPIALRIARAISLNTEFDWKHADADLKDR